MILAYGPQENDPETNCNLFYQNLSIQIEQAFLSEDSVIMVGDFNAKLGKDVIGGEVHPMSPNGKLLFSLCNKYNLFILNSSNLCKAVFTRIHNYTNKVKKSVLEYVLVSADLYSQFVSMHIDEEKLFTPWRLINKGKRFPDHCAIRFQMELNYRKRNHEKTKTKVWNFNDPLGWEKFRMLTGCESSVRFMWESLGNTEDPISFGKSN